MRHFRVSAAAFGVLLLLPSAVQAQTLSAGELNDLACFFALSTIANQAASANKMEQAQTAKAVGMFYAGKMTQRHPGKPLLPMLNANKAALEPILSKFNPQTCLTEAQAAVTGK